MVGRQVLQAVAQEVGTLRSRGEAGTAGCVDETGTRGGEWLRGGTGVASGAEKAGTGAVSSAGEAGMEAVADAASCDLRVV